MLPPQKGLCALELGRPSLSLTHLSLNCPRDTLPLPLGFKGLCSWGETAQRAGTEVLQPPWIPAPPWRALSLCVDGVPLHGCSWDWDWTAFLWEPAPRWLVHTCEWGRGRVHEWPTGSQACWSQGWEQHGREAGRAARLGRGPGWGLCPHTGRTCHRCPWWQTAPVSVGAWVTLPALSAPPFTVNTVMPKGCLWPRKCSPNLETFWWRL